MNFKITRYGRRTPSTYTDPTGSDGYETEGSRVHWWVALGIISLSRNSVQNFLPEKAPSMIKACTQNQDVDLLVQSKPSTFHHHLLLHLVC